MTQSLSSPFFSVLMSILNFCFSHIAFIFLFAIVFLLIKKDDAIKIGYCYSLSFLFGGFFLNNVVKSPKPYISNPELFGVRNGASWGSFPSVRSMNVSGVVGCATIKSVSQRNKWWFACTIFLWVLACFCVGFVETYNAEAYLVDIVFGVVLGALIYVLTFYFVRKIPQKLNSLLLLVVPIAILFLYIEEWGEYVGHEYVFDMCGFFVGLVVFSYLENKFIGYKIKNNVIFSTFKILIIVPILSLLFWAFSFIPQVMIVRFVLSLLVMAVVMLGFPFLFNKLEKYCYCFKKDVKQDKLVFSKITFGEKGTNNLAKIFAKKLKAGDFVVLEGDLGAGKTVFTRAILRERNVKNNITSPTFTILNEYNEGENNFYHFDMYRLTDESEVDNVGFFDAINDKNGIVFVEWAENISSYLPPHFKKITIVKLGKNARNIVFEQF